MSMLAIYDAARIGLDMSGTNPLGGVVFPDSKVKFDFLTSPDANTALFRVTGSDLIESALVSGSINYNTGDAVIQQITYFNATNDIIFIWGEMNGYVNLNGDFTKGISYSILNGNDYIQGNNFSDFIKGGRGNDDIDGKGGIDTVGYTGYRQEYSVSKSGNFYYIADKVSGRDGSDAMKNIERIHFTDGNLVLDVPFTSDDSLIYRLYQAAFGRTPDEGGFRFWVSQHDKGMSFSDIAGLFRTSPEFTQKYGSNVSTSQYVDNLYKNILGRAGETAGINFWVNELNTGHATKDQVLIGFAGSPENVSKTSANIDNGYWLV